MRDKDLENSLEVMIVVGTKVQMENEYKPGRFDNPIRVIQPNEILQFIDKGPYIRKVLIHPDHFSYSSNKINKVSQGEILEPIYSWLDIKTLKELAERSLQKGREGFISTNEDRLIRLIAGYGNLEAMKYLVEEVGLSCSLSSKPGHNVKYGTLKRAIYYQQPEMIMYLWNKMSQGERDECTKTFLNGKTPSQVAMEKSFELRDKVHHGPLVLEEYDPGIVCNIQPHLWGQMIAGYVWI
jgi:hypothetical protein